MQKNLLFTSALLLMGSLLFNSCSESGEHKSEQQESSTEEQTNEGCFYAYNEGSTELVWTAYKTTGKVPVGGSFDNITVYSEKAEDPIDVLRSVEFVIETGTVNSNNPERDAKIAEHFFGTMGTTEITGKMRSIGKNGKAVISIVMHGIELDVEGDYTLEGADFTFTSSLDLSKWNGMEAVNALNTVCKDLHAGEDGESKLWSEVGLSFKTTLHSDCE